MNIYLFNISLLFQNHLRDTKNDNELPRNNNFENKKKNGVEMAMQHGIDLGDLFKIIKYIIIIFFIGFIFVDHQAFKINK